MLPFLRMAKVLLRPTPRKRAGLFEGTTVRFRVWPNDLDLNLHMNNSRYLALMDLGRYDLVRKAGVWAIARRNGWRPVVASQRIRFRRSLRPFSRFTIETRQIGWDDRSIYLEQRFVQAGEVAAIGLVRATFLGKKGTRVPPDELMAACGWTGERPALPASVSLWNEAERADQ